MWLESNAKGHRVRLKVGGVFYYGPYRRIKAVAEADLGEVEGKHGSEEKKQVLVGLKNGAGGGRLRRGGWRGRASASGGASATGEAQVPVVAAAVEGRLQSETTRERSHGQSSATGDMKGPLQSNQMVQSNYNGRHRVRLKLARVYYYGPYRKTKAGAEEDLAELERQDGSAERKVELLDRLREAAGGRRGRPVARRSAREGS